MLGQHGPHSVLQIPWKVARGSQFPIVSYPKSYLLLGHMADIFSSVLVRWLRSLLERLSETYLPSRSITQPAAHVLLMWQGAQEGDGENRLVDG